MLLQSRFGCCWWSNHCLCVVRRGCQHLHLSAVRVNIVRAGLIHRVNRRVVDVRIVVHELLMLRMEGVAGHDGQLVLLLRLQPLRLLRLQLLKFVQLWLRL